MAFFLEKEKLFDNRLYLPIQNFNNYMLFNYYMRIYIFIIVIKKINYRKNRINENLLLVKQEITENNVILLKIIKEF